MSGVFGAGLSMLETMVPAYFTGGLSLIPQIGGPMYFDYNKAKADRLYGEADPNAMQKLLENNQSEVTTPFVAASVSLALERAGLKAVDDYIRATPFAQKMIGRLAITGNREGATEIGQLGVETINISLGQGDTMQEASIKGVKSMYSEDGLEAYLGGFIGSTSVGAGGRVLNRA